MATKKMTAGKPATQKRAEPSGVHEDWAQSLVNAIEDRCGKKLSFLGKKKERAELLRDLVERYFGVGTISLIAVEAMERALQIRRCAKAEVAALADNEADRMRAVWWAATEMFPGFAPNEITAVKNGEVRLFVSHFGTHLDEAVTHFLIKHFHEGYRFGPKVRYRMILEGGVPEATRKLVEKLGGIFVGVGRGELDEHEGKEDEEGHVPKSSAAILQWEELGLRRKVQELLARCEGEKNGVDEAVRRVKVIITYATFCDSGVGSDFGLAEMMKWVHYNVTHHLNERQERYRFAPERFTEEHLREEMERVAATLLAYVLTPDVSGDKDMLLGCVMDGRKVVLSGNADHVLWEELKKHLPEPVRKAINTAENVKEACNLLDIYAQTGKEREKKSVVRSVRLLRRIERYRELQFESRLGRVQETRGAHVEKERKAVTEELPPDVSRLEVLDAYRTCAFGLVPSYARLVRAEELPPSDPRHVPKGTARKALAAWAAGYMNQQEAFLLALEEAERATWCKPIVHWPKGKGPLPMLAACRTANWKMRAALHYGAEGGAVSDLEVVVDDGRVMVGANEQKFSTLFGVDAILRGVVTLLRATEMKLAGVPFPSLTRERDGEEKPCYAWDRDGVPILGQSGRMYWGSVTDPWYVAAKYAAFGVFVGSKYHPHTPPTRLSPDLVLRLVRIAWSVSLWANHGADFADTLDDVADRIARLRRSNEKAIGRCLSSIERQLSKLSAPPPKKQVEAEGVPEDEVTDDGDVDDIPTEDGEDLSGDGEVLDDDTDDED